MTPVILDMDPGVDDALALLLALRCPELSVRAVTTVSGNVPVDQGTDNALRVLTLAGRDDVPVYRGADVPLIGEPVHAEHIHGAGGLGDAVLPPSTREIAGDAVAFLLDGLAEAPGLVTLIATGPLTNLALAEGRQPGVLRQAARVVIMGGALQDAGNAAPGCEFNFWADPQAAREVLRSGADILLVPLDATHQVLLSPDELSSMAAGDAGPLRQFVRMAAALPMATARREYGYDGLYLHDPLAVAVVARPDLVRVVSASVDVETQGELTAGRLVADERTFTDPSHRHGTLVEWVSRVNREAFLEWFTQRLPGASAPAVVAAR